jgi:hypothetical protein
MKLMKLMRSKKIQFQRNCLPESFGLVPIPKLKQSSYEYNNEHRAQEIAQGEESVCPRVPSMDEKV